MHDNINYRNEIIKNNVYIIYNYNLFTILFMGGYIKSTEKHVYYA